ncbi:MAG: polynucleotide adenylyltransferase PcnB [Xanthomonadales bacterium]|nr:polynucleotide adenylyltransferase PcnB [Xanthomonadales bacterium]
MPLRGDNISSLAGQDFFISNLKIIPAFKHGIASAELCPHASEVVRQLQQAGYESYIVGGSVRDLLLGSLPKDFDVATSATPEQVQQVFPRCRLIGRRFRLAHVRLRGVLTEVATFRGQHDSAGENENDHGRILRDNVWGDVEEDAVRRDFTINAMFLDPISGEIRDYLDGYQDLADKRLRLIGDPEQRYKEDPVRLLRAARFVAKLGVRPDPATEAPIRKMARLLQDVPPARLFEEVCKLFLTGHGRASFDALQEFGLTSILFPALKPEGKDGRVEAGPLLLRALENTDLRVREDRPVTPAFLFAALLWQPIRDRTAKLLAGGMTEDDAIGVVAEEVFLAQSRRTAIPRRFSAVTRLIWSMQPRLARTRGKRWKKLLAEPRFRAGYDFLLLRAVEDPTLQELSEFWTQAQIDFPLDEARAEAANDPDQPATEQRDGRHRPRRRRRKPSNKN